MLLTTAFLAASVLSVWLPAMPLPDGRRLPLWPLCLAATLLCALLQGQADWRGAAAVVALCAMGLASLHGPVPARRLLMAGTVLLAFAMGLRQVPGFHHVVFLDNIRLSPDASPMRLTAHLDAGIAGLVLLALYARRCTSFGELAGALRVSVPIIVLTTTLVILLAWALGYVRPQLNLPWFAWAHLTKILLWTCVLEEAFFRGVLQERLARMALFADRPALRHVPLLVAATLFGLVHLPGGWTYAGLAALAGIGYGLAYARTLRIEAAIAAHFVLNATHFLGFTYPQIAGG